MFLCSLSLSAYPSIAYPCWDHSGRTVLRIIMYANVTILSGILPSSCDSIQKYEIATISDFLFLKQKNPNCGVKHTDITPHLKQNCDATSRVLTKKTISELSDFVPQSAGTQHYLTAAVCTHELYRNVKFGPPPEIAESLWKIWQVWRQYIQLMPELTLTNNFISYAHYMTEELLVHAGINHYYVCTYCFLISLLKNILYGIQATVELKHFTAFFEVELPLFP